MVRNLVKQHIVKNLWQYALLFVIFLMGTVVGVINATDLDGPTRTHLVQIIDNFLKGEDIGSQGGYRLFFTAFINQARVIAMIWFLGLTVIGIPFIFAIIFFKGFSLGFTLGFLIKEKAWQGILMATASVVPQNLLYIPLFLAWAVTGVNFSLCLVRGRFSRGSALGPGLVTYTGLMLVFLSVFFLGAFIEAFLSPWLLDLVVK